VLVLGRRAVLPFIGSVLAVFSELAIRHPLVLFVGFIAGQALGDGRRARCGDGAAGGVGEGGDAEADGGGAAGGDLVHLGEFVPGAGQADFQAFGFAEPVAGPGPRRCGR